MCFANGYRTSGPLRLDESALISQLSASLIYMNDINVLFVCFTLFCIFKAYCADFKVGKGARKKSHCYEH